MRVTQEIQDHIPFAHVKNVGLRIIDLNVTSVESEVHVLHQQLNTECDQVDDHDDDDGHHCCHDHHHHHDGCDEDE